MRSPPRTGQPPNVVSATTVRPMPWEGEVHRTNSSTARSKSCGSARSRARGLRVLRQVPRRAADGADRRIERPEKDHERREENLLVFDGAAVDLPAEQHPDQVVGARLLPHILHPLADPAEHLEPRLEDQVEVRPDLDGDLGDPGRQVLSVAVPEPENSQGHVLGERSCEHLAVVEPADGGQGAHQLLCHLADLGLSSLHRGRREQIVDQPPILPMQGRVDLERRQLGEGQLRNAGTVRVRRESSPVAARLAKVLISGNDPEATVALAPGDGLPSPERREDRVGVSRQRGVEVVVGPADSGSFVRHRGLGVHR